MNIETTKLELMHLLLKTQKQSLLAKLKKVFEDETEDWWNEMSYAEQEEIEQGLSEVENNNYISNEDTIKRFDKWR